MPISSSSIDTLAEEIFKKIRSYNPELDLTKLKRAYDFAKRAHQGQLRRSGEPYLTHPLRTVLVLTHLRVDEDTLIAALLHDVPEDTKVQLKEIEKEFGSKIAYLVDGVTKLAKVQYRASPGVAPALRHIESLKKLFVHSAEDLRAILIKLADRLDNMRTLRFIADEKKRVRIARETLEIYVPIANLLGIGEMRAELEDLCFEYLYPLDYSNLKLRIEEHMEARTFILQEMIRLTDKELKKHNIEAEILGRPKTLYSIYKKLQTKKTIQNIDDLIAIRAIVKTRTECYDALGILHHLFKPKIDSFKDYIALPKPNGYQSLHTTVFGLNNSIIEFQIRTRYMHLEAEYGIAAHYFYKYADEKELAAIMQQRSSWVQRVLEMQKDQKDPEHFLENLKLDIFQDRIFVFSPKGDVVDLPRSASVLDFAYAIHTDIGNHAIKAEVNGIISPVTAKLKTGDTVSIMTSKESKPEREWLNFVKTSLATNKIKEFLKGEPVTEKLAAGKKFLQKELDRLGKNIKGVVQKTPGKTLDELLIAIAEGELDPSDILDIDTANKDNRPETVSLCILGKNDKEQFKEIIRTINALHIPIAKFNIDSSKRRNCDRCTVKITVKNYNELAQIFESLEQLEGVSKISRVFDKRPFFFLIGGLAAIAVSVVSAYFIAQMF